MRLVAVALLLQVLSARDPGPMEKAPDLGYIPVPHGFSLPSGVTMGAPSSVATTSKGHLLVFNRGPYPLLEFDRNGAFVRAFGEGRYVRPHGMRLDADDNIWTTDVAAHTVTKMSLGGEVLLVLGVSGQAGDWNERASSGFLNEPTDIAIGRAGAIFVLQGHGQADSRVLRFDKRGTLEKSWGGKGAGPGQFDIAHGIAVDAKGMVYVADRQNRRIQVFDGDGKFIKEWKYQGLPCGLYIGTDQQLYMVSGYSGQILKLDANGHVVAATGQPGKELGQFGEAHYLTFGPAGEIYVADTIGARLHKFVKK
jgi:DNA-binding beta-propeller fold protein YncE